MESKSEVNVYMIHRALAVFLDIVVVMLFVVGGQQEHEGDFYFGDYIRIALPFLAVFFAVQLIMGKDQRNIKYAAIAGAISVPIAFLLRVAQPQHDFEPAFLIVAFLFLNTGWILWRFALNKLRPSKTS